MVRGNRVNYRRYLLRAIQLTKQTRHATSAVLTRCGVAVFLAHALQRLQIGLMITASHNPEPDNGAKLVDPMGEMLEVCVCVDASWNAACTHESQCVGMEMEVREPRRCTLGYLQYYL